jgi:hypothetical protein
MMRAEAEGMKRHVAAMNELVGGRADARKPAAARAKPAAASQCPAPAGEGRGTELNRRQPAAAPRPEEIIPLEDAFEDF